MNAAAVFQTNRYNHITPLLHRLHWFRVTAHIIQACLHGVPVRPWTWTGLPGQVRVTRIPGRQRLIMSTSALYVPSTRLFTVGDQAFPVAAARSWNSLPAEVTSSNSLQTFKTELKSHLFLAPFP